jgi:hypothetical protein
MRCLCWVKVSLRSPGPGALARPLLAATAAGVALQPESPRVPGARSRRGGQHLSNRIGDAIAVDLTRDGARSVSRVALAIFVDGDLTRIIRRMQADVA